MDTEQKTPRSGNQVEQLVILPCPFCGGKADLIMPTEMIYDFPKEGDEWGLVKIYVYCRGCGCKQRESSSPDSRHEDIENFKKQAVDAWNKRAI